MAIRVLSVKNIVVVEDSPIVAAHIKSCLESMGCNVQGMFKSGEDAIQFLGHEPSPDLILMDVMLDGKLDGVETVEKIHSSYDLSVVYITALSDRESLKRMEATNPSGYIMKPFQEDHFTEVVENALRK